MVNLTAVDLSDSGGAQEILDALCKRWPWVKHLFADAAHDKTQLMDKVAYLYFVIEVVRRLDEKTDCQVVPADGLSSAPSGGSPAGDA